MSWRLIPNAAYRGRQPQLLATTCHDRTPALTIQCDCGELLHVHEGALDAAARLPAPTLGARCTACDALLTFPRALFAEAFAEMRRQGWFSARQERN